jgi:hypothetical protein
MIPENKWNAIFHTKHSKLTEEDLTIFKQLIQEVYGKSYDQLAHDEYQYYLKISTHLTDKEKRNGRNLGFKPYTFTLKDGYICINSSLLRMVNGDKILNNVLFQSSYVDNGFVNDNVLVLKYTALKAKQYLNSISELLRLSKILIYDTKERTCNFTIGRMIFELTNGRTETINELMPNEIPILEATLKLRIQEFNLKN